MRNRRPPPRPSRDAPRDQHTYPELGCFLTYALHLVLPIGFFLITAHGWYSPTSLAYAIARRVLSCSVADELQVPSAFFLRPPGDARG